MKGEMTLTTCTMLHKQMLTNSIDVNVDSRLDYDQAREIADRKASEAVPDPMLMAWYEKRTGRFSPQVECCSEEKPGWLVYAESRGGDIIVDINDQEYVFVYRGD